MNYKIFVNRKKVSIELKISSLMSLKMFTFLRAFSDILGVECRKTSIFFVKYSENHRIFPDGSIGKIIGRGMLNILLFFISRRLAIAEAEEI